MSRFALVIVDIQNQEVDRIFTYRIPEGMKVCPGLRVAVPFGRQARVEGLVISLSDTSSVPENKMRDILACLDKEPLLGEEQLKLAAWIRNRYYTTMADALRLFIPSEVRTGKVKDKYVQVLRLAQSKDQTESILASMRPGTKAYRILAFLAEYGETDKPTLVHTVGPCYEPLKKLVAQGFVSVDQEEVTRSPYLDIAPERTPWLKLNERQKAVLNDILAHRKAFTPYLLHGVTGSGKTEVYMQAIREVTEAGKTAIVLVPEISLTPQMVLNFRKRLGDGIAILHSALGAGERYDEWKRVLSGEARIVIGARSAIFAPAKNVGLIIIDEEHETSYQSETYPRYDAVEIALERGRYNGCPVILGSATPSVNRYFAAQNGFFRLLEMPERANGKPLPAVDVVDMTEEFSHGNRTMFSEKLYVGMCETLKKNEQLMLFLNRRGYASFVMCRACGETIACENCDVSLTYHTTVNKLRCHYCGYEIPMPRVCPACGSKFIKQFGAGTQKVEEEFLRLFPDKKVVRMDVDTTRGKDAHYQLLKQLSDGTAQALIGTQMIAKGHDFPKVSLVGVIAADSMLRLPDYRSRERTFSLITQVAGRAGRARIPGHVVVQTYTPQHFVIQCAANHDYKGFYEKEIEERRAMWYPPFARIIRFLYTAEQAEKSYDASLKATDAMKPLLDENSDLVLYDNTSAAPIGRLQELYRHQILIKLKESGETDGLVNRLVEAVKAVEQKNVYCDIQINPVSLF